MTSRTHGQMFDAWRATNPKCTWRDFRIQERDQLIRKYLDCGFHLIRLGQKVKRPVDSKWPEFSLDYLQAMDWLSAKGNIGVMGGPKMIIIDWDDSMELPFMSKTLTSISPNGFHIFTKGKYGPRQEKIMQKIKWKYPSAFKAGPLVRANNGYVVIPPSETCIDEHSQHLCEEKKIRHDYRMHEWLNLNSPILPFREFAKECLK